MVILKQNLNYNKNEVSKGIPILNNFSISGPSSVMTSQVLGLRYNITISEAIKQIKEVNKLNSEPPYKLIGNVDVCSMSPDSKQINSLQLLFDNDCWETTELISLDTNTGKYRNHILHIWLESEYYKVTLPKLDIKDNDWTTAISNNSVRDDIINLLVKLSINFTRSINLKNIINKLSINYYNKIEYNYNLNEIKGIRDTLDEVVETTVTMSDHILRKLHIIDLKTDDKSLEFDSILSIPNSSQETTNITAPRSEHESIDSKSNDDIRTSNLTNMKSGIILVPYTSITIKSYVVSNNTIVSTNLDYITYLLTCKDDNDNPRWLTWYETPESLREIISGMMTSLLLHNKKFTIKYKVDSRLRITSHNIPVGPISNKLVRSTYYLYDESSKYIADTLLSDINKITKTEEEINDNINTVNKLKEELLPRTAIHASRTFINNNINYYDTVKHIEWAHNTSINEGVNKCPKGNLSDILPAWYAIKNNNPLDILIKMDATASGIQHSAGLCLDIKMGILSNLLDDNTDDYPKDLYTEIYKESNIYGKYLDLCTRSESKYVLMTAQYGASQTSIAMKLLNEISIPNDKTKWYINYYITKLLKSGKHPTNKSLSALEGIHKRTGEVVTINDYRTITKRVLETQDKMIPRLAILNKYLRNVAKLMSNHDLPIYMNIGIRDKIITDITYSNYTKIKELKVRSRLIGKKTTITLPTNERDNSKEVTAILANMRHILDALTLHKTILLCNENKIEILTVHDMICCKIKHADDLLSKYREAIQWVHIGSNLNKHIIEDIHSLNLDAWVKNNHDENSIPSLPSIILNDEIQNEFSNIKNEVITSRTPLLSEGSSNRKQSYSIKKPSKSTDQIVSDNDKSSDKKDTIITDINIMEEPYWIPEGDILDV